MLAIGNLDLLYFLVHVYNEKNQSFKLFGILNTVLLYIRVSSIDETDRNETMWVNFFLIVGCNNDAYKYFYGWMLKCRLPVYFAL
jgi:hypothetical protein